MRIKQSKTDPFRQGVTLFLGKTGLPICPVDAILPYLAVRDNRPGPLFILQDGRMLTRQTFGNLLDNVLDQLHLPSGEFNTHSFRIGAATSAKEAGISDSQIMMLGRWQSNAYQRYIRTPPESLAQLSKVLATGGQATWKLTPWWLESIHTLITNASLWYLFVVHMYINTAILETFHILFVYSIPLFMQKIFCNRLILHHKHNAWVERHLTVVWCLSMALG